MGAKRTLVARALRLAVIQNQYDIGNLSTEEAKELLRGCLKPGDESTCPLGHGVIKGVA